MFTVQQRDALRERVLGLAQADARVVAGAAVGSLALGGGGRFSDLDLTFAIADHVPLTDWTRTLRDERAAVPLADLVRGPTTYRVYLLPAALQCDLSLTPAARFRPAGPRFRLLFGQTAAGAAADPTPAGAGTLGLPTPVGAEDLLGWGVIYALHARACIERGRVWQAEHYVGAVRDHALALACLREGVPAGQARGYDDLSAETLARFGATHVGAVEPGALHAALAEAVRALLDEGAAAGLAHAESVAQRLGDCADAALPCPVVALHLSASRPRRVKGAPTC